MIEIHEALRIAVEALRHQGAFLHDRYRLTASRVDDRWVFWFVFLPETPGQDMTVTVGDGGDARVTSGF
jgi:hypothetical protein